MFTCALIGCGYWGIKLKQYIKNHPELKLVTIANSKTNLHSIWKDQNINAVAIATPNETHYTLVKKALLSGKHVLSEKPLTLTYTEGKEIMDIAFQNNLVVLVDYVYTFSKALQKAQTIIKNNCIGNLLGIEMIIRRLGRFHEGNVYWLLASHMLAVLDMFMPLNELHFVRKDIVIRDNQCETGQIFFKKATISGHIIASLNYPHKESQIIFYGENGTVIYSANTQPSLHIERYERIKLRGNLPQQRKGDDFHIEDNNNLQFVIEHFVEMLQGKKESNIKRAIAVTKIIESIL